jgi:exosortase
VSRLLGVLLPLCVAYAGTFGWLYESWGFGEAYYAHGPLVVAFAALVVFRWRNRLTEKEAGWDPRGWLLLGPGLFLHLCGAALMIDSLSGASLILSVPGAIWLAYGLPRLSILAPVLGLIPFIVPLPIAVQGKLAFQLKEFAIQAGLVIANALGADAHRTGAEIGFPGIEGSLIVADPCSGLRSLVALITLGYCVAFFLGTRAGARPWILLAAAGPIAVLTNVLRIAAICWIARFVSVEFASGRGHDIASVAIWVVDLGMLLGLDAWLSRLRRRNP